MSEPETMKINNVEYVRKDSVSETKVSTDGLPYAIVRCDRSGVYAGFIYEDRDSTVEIVQARKLWYWDGAASLSQLSQDGVKNPGKCKFPAEIPSVSVRDCIEVIPATTKCYNSIGEVKIWEV